MSGHSIGSLETWEPEDKSFSKHPFKEGTGTDKPNEGSTCVVHIAMVGDDSPEEQDLGGYKLNTDHEVTIGEGDTALSGLFDKVVSSMLEGETSYIKSKVDKKGNKVPEFNMSSKALKFNCTLKTFSRAVDSTDLEQDERLDRAQHHKDKGTELYQKDKLEFSMKRFQKALQYLKDMEPVESLPGDLMLQYRKLKCQCYLNLGACYLKKEKYDCVIDNCGMALSLEKDNVKGLFRRGQAYAKLHKYEEARVDLNRALQIEPENKAVKNQLVTVYSLVKKEKQMYQKMMGASSH